MLPGGGSAGPAGALGGSAMARTAAMAVDCTVAPSGFVKYLYLFSPLTSAG